MLDVATTVEERSRRREHVLPKPIADALKLFASLRLTVVLLGMSVFLVFIGTVAQIEGGIWTIVHDYFRSFVVMVPFQLFVILGQKFLSFPATWQLDSSIAFPYPGGWTLGGLLLINLIAAHLVRFKLTWRRAGILMLHTGIVLLMVGELITGLFQVESKMHIGTNETVNYIQDSRAVELVVIDDSNPREAIEICVPQAMLQVDSKTDHKIQHADLPFDLVVYEFMKNSDLTPLRGNESANEVLTSLMGKRFGFTKLKEVSGVDPDQHEDMAAARVRIIDKANGKIIGERLVSVWFSPLVWRRLPIYRFAPIQIEHAGKTFQLELRPRREYLPFSLTLKEFRFDRYPGTATPRNYSSLVTLREAGSEGRDVLIRMNEPLATHGQTFYQSGFTEDEKGTILHVTRNPGVWLPYISCSLVALGMVWHFGLMLTGFLKKQGVA